MHFNSKTLQLFLESKTEEISLIIKKHYNKSPETIAKLIVTNLDCSTLPLSLSLKRSINDHQ